MMTRSVRLARALSPLFVLGGVLLGDTAAAQSGGACQAVQRTEAQRKAGKYRAARAKLLDCVNAQCGGDVRRRCAATLQQLDAVTPSIVIRAEDELGNDVIDVSVKLGGEPLADSLDGIAIPVDPGEHTLVLERPGHAPVEKKFTIRRGEKFRSIEVNLGPQPDKYQPLPEGGTPDARLSTARIALGSSLIGVGVAGLVGFGWLGTSARSGEDELEQCKPFCGKGRVDEVGVRYVLANVSLGVSALALGAATYVLLTGSSPAPEEQTEDGLAVSAGPGGAFATLSGRF